MYALDVTRFDEAVTAINALASSAKPGFSEFYDLRAVSAATLAELLEHDRGADPLWQGALMLLAKHTLVPPTTSIEVSSFDELERFSDDLRFHHGDVVVSGDFSVWENVWITGSLEVEGVITTSFVDSYCDFLVGGDVTCSAISFLGLSLVAGTVTAKRLAHVWSQGENWLLGDLQTPVLVSDDGALDHWTTSRVGHEVDHSHA